MALDKVSKIEITAHYSVMDKLLEELQELSVLQIDPHSIENWENEKDKLENIEENIASLKSVLAKIDRAISFIEPYAPPEPFFQKLAGNLPEVKKDELKEISERKKAQDLVEDLLSKESEMNEIKSSIKDFNQKIHDLLPIKALNVKISHLKLKYCRSVVSKLDREKFEELKDNFNIKLGYLEEIGGEDTVYFIVVFHRDSESEFEKLSKEFRIEPISLPETGKTIADLIEEYRRNVGELEDRLNILVEKLKELSNNVDAIKYYHDYLSTELEKEEVKKKFFFTRKTFVIDGWIRERDYKELESLTSKFNEVFVTKIKKKEEEQPPVVYKNNKLVSPFELIVNLYSPPNPKEIDPTPILMPFYAVFFGICLTEAGYGFVIMLLTALALIFLKPRGGKRKFITLFLILGFFTLVIGSLIGTVFGINFDNLPQNLEWLRRARYKIMIFDSSKDVLTFFALSLALGVIHLIAGYIIKIYMLLRDGEWAEAVCDHLPWIFLLLSPVPKVLVKALPAYENILNVIFYILVGLWAGILLFFSERSSLNPVKRIGKGLFTLYGVSSVLADVLSYSRLLALGLATGVIAGVMNTLAKMVKQIPYVGIIGFVLVLVGGHMFNLLISGLGAFVHSIRLQFMEFFTKFYTGEGVLFEPFTEKRKFTFKPEGAKK